MKPVDRALGFGGLSLALMSLGFALHAMSTADEAPSIPGNEHLLIFSRPANLARAALNDAVGELARGPIGPTEGDPIATGSIGRRSAAPASPIEGYALLQVFGDRALLRGPHGLILAGPGTGLDAAGTMRGLARRNGRWLVETSAGVIEAAR